MAKSFILLLCIALASVIVLNVSTKSGDRDVLAKNASEPATIDSHDDSNAPILLDLTGLIERPAETGYWYLVRSNGACNSYGTKYDAQSLSRNWQADINPGRSRVVY